MEQERIKNNEYGCTLFIDTEVDHPDLLSQRLNLEASKIEVKGENKRYPKTGRVISDKYYAFNLWRFSIEKRDYPYSEYLNKPIEELLDLMDQKRDLFLKAFQQYQKRHILIYAYFYDFNPYFLLNKDIIKRLAVYEIDIEFDLYYFS